MRTSIGAAQRLGYGFTTHTIVANLMPTPISEQQRLEYQGKLQNQLLGLRQIQSITIDNQSQLRVEIAPCTTEQRVAALRAVLQAMQEIGLHDPQQGIVSCVRGL